MRPALLTWSKTFWPERNIHALSDLYEFAPAANLGSTIQPLEAARYSLQKDETKARGTDIILREVEQIRASRQQVHEVKQARLAELYPSVSR